MAVSLEIYRVRIGCHIQPKSKKIVSFGHPKPKRINWVICHFLIVYAALTVSLSLSYNLNVNIQKHGDTKNFQLNRFETDIFFYSALTTFGHGIFLNVNFYAKYTNGNKKINGIKIVHFNKGSAFLENSMHEIESIVQDHQPHILGISEANFLHNHDPSDCSIEGYEMLTAKTLSNPSILASRIVVYKHSSVIGKLRPDLMDDKFSSIWLETGLPRQKKILVCQLYREWQYLGQEDIASKSAEAQLSRWNLFLGQWERALATGYECHIFGDFNFDARILSHSEIALKPYNNKFKPMIEALVRRVLPNGITQLVAVPTRQEAILDQLWSNSPDRISPVTVECRGGF